MKYTVFEENFAMNKKMTEQEFAVTAFTVC